MTQFVIDGPALARELRSVDLALRTMPEAMARGVLSAGLAAAARVVAARARRKVPVRTGRLKRSIRTRRVGVKQLNPLRGRSFTAPTLRVRAGRFKSDRRGDDAPYAYLVERRTGFMAAAGRETAGEQLAAFLRGCRAQAVRLDMRALRRGEAPLNLLR